VPRRIKDQRLVIVEDDAFISESLKMYFSLQNEVMLFGTAEDALAAADQFEGVNVFIVDYRLPGKDGVELFQQLRLRFPKAKYVLITGEMSYDLAESTRKLGFDALILKPFDFTILEDNLSTLVSAP
jgi:two-component system, NtrC family, response regulator GlrR